MVKISPSNAGGAGSIPGQGTKIPCSLTEKPKKKKKIKYNKYYKNFIKE